MVSPDQPQLPGIAFERSGNSKAQPWLETLQQPEALEQFSYDELRAQLRNTNFVEVNADEVTIGWGERSDVVGNDSRTMVRCITADNSLVCFSLGRDSYSLDLLARDASRPTEQEMEKMMRVKRYFIGSAANNYRNSSRAQQWIESHMSSSAVSSKQIWTISDRAWWIMTLGTHRPGKK